MQGADGEDSAANRAGDNAELAPAGEAGDMKGENGEKEEVEARSDDEMVDGGAEGEEAKPKKGEI